MSQTRTPSPSVQPMFLDGIWRVRDVSAGVVVVIVGTGSTVTVSTTVWVAPTTVTVSVLPPPHAASVSTSPKRRTSRLTHGSLVLHAPHLAMAAAPLLSRLRAQACVLPQLERPQLPLE